MKFLLVANLSLGANFIAQLKVHWSCAKVGYEEMTQENLVNVAIVKVDPQENWNLVKFLNGDQVIQNQNFFPPRPINKPSLDLWLSRKTFKW